MSGRALPFIGSRDPWGSGAKTAAATCLLAPNASAWTLDGTNTWLLRDPNARASIVVDPGPDDSAHLQAIIDWASDADAPITTIVLTHGHPDHADGAGTLHRMCGAPVRAFDPTHRFGDEGLVAGDVMAVGALELRVVETPGHTHDSVSLHLPSEGSLLTGDTILGRGTAVVAWPDGDLGEYFASLSRLRELIGVDRLLPGHGPLLEDAGAVIDAYLEHRRVRLDEVRDAVASGLRTPDEIVDSVYAELGPQLRAAALQSARAQLAYLGIR